MVEPLTPSVTSGWISLFQVVTTLSGERSSVQFGHPSGTLKVGAEVSLNGHQ